MCGWGETRRWTCMITASVHASPLISTSHPIPSQQAVQIQVFSAGVEDEVFQSWYPELEAESLLRYRGDGSGNADDVGLGDLDVQRFKVRPSLWTPCIVCGKEMAAVWLRRLRSGWGIEASSPGDLSRPPTTITRPIRTTSGSLRRRASGTTSSSSTSSWTRPWTSGTRRPPRPRYYGAFGVDGPTLLVPSLPDQDNLT